MNRCLILGTSLGLAALAGGGCVLDGHDGAEGTFSRTLSVSGPVDLEAWSGSGAIQIRAGNAGTVVVQGHVWASWNCWSLSDADERVRDVESKPPIEQSGNEIRLGAARSALDCVSISFDVTVPPDTRVRARSGSGSQSVTGVRGPVDVRSGSGTVRISQIVGDVEASAGSGSIDVAAARGATIARAGSGSIRVADAEGDVEAHTGSGRVVVSHMGRGRTDATTGSGGISVSAARGPLRLRAGSGSISVEGEPAGSWNVGTGSGSIDLRIPSTAPFDLDAHTNSGRILSDHEIVLVDSVSRRELRGRVRGGGPRIDVSTGSGSIRLQ